MSDDTERAQMVKEMEAIFQQVRERYVATGSVTLSHNEVHFLMALMSRDVSHEDIQAAVLEGNGKEANAAMERLLTDTERLSVAKQVLTLDGCNKLMDKFIGLHAQLAKDDKEDTDTPSSDLAVVQEALRDSERTP